MNMVTIEITREAFDLLQERMEQIYVSNYSDVIMAMDEIADLMSKQYMDLIDRKRKIEKNRIRKRRCQ